MACAKSYDGSGKQRTLLLLLGGGLGSVTTGGGGTTSRCGSSGATGANVQKKLLDVLAFESLCRG